MEVFEFLSDIFFCKAVVSFLNNLRQTREKFRSLIEGESLINDATCMILIIISVNILKGGSSGLFSIIINFLSLSFGGMLIGVIFYKLGCVWSCCYFLD